MDKAYDLKALGEKLIETGLPLAKDALESEALKVYAVLKDWLKESAALSDNKIDDFAISFIDKLDPLVLPQIDKINGKEG